MNSGLFSKLCLTMLIMPVLSGCISPDAGPQARFYQLQPIPDVTVDQAVANDVPIRLGPVEVSPYLGRPQMVKRIGANTLNYNEFERWAEPLQKNVGWVVSQNLSALMGNEQIFMLRSVKSSPHSVSIALQVSRFETSSDGKAYLVANWELRQRQNDESRWRSRSASLSGDAGQSTEQHVAAMDALLLDLSRKIADSLKEFTGETP